MTKKCELTGVLPLKGHNVSHANNKTKRRFLPKATDALLKLKTVLTKHKAALSKQARLFINAVFVQATSQPSKCL